MRLFTVNDDLVCFAGDNVCRVKNGGCSQLCLYAGSRSVRCKCAYGKVMNVTQCESGCQIYVWLRITDRVIFILCGSHVSENYIVTIFVTKYRIYDLRVVLLTAKPKLPELLVRKTSYKNRR